LPGIQLVQYDEFEKNNYQYVVAEVDETQTGINRDNLNKILWAENVLARRYFYPGCHQAEPYSSYYPHAKFLLPETEKLVQRVLVLPNGTSVSPDEISTVCQIIRFAVEHAGQIEPKLREVVVKTPTSF
jgi:dTDP-4-amino-4,6-dideoxygalactose transaminase